MEKTNSIFDDATSLVDVLTIRASEERGQGAFIFLEDGENQETSWSYFDLDRRARAIAVNLIRKGTTPGDRIMLVYPPSLDFIAGFFGCLYAGAIPVPVYPPLSQDAITAVLAIAKNSGSERVLTTKDLQPAIDFQFTSFGCPLASCDPSEAINHDLGTYWTKPEITSQTTAFIQYTSGSTGKPKGVVISHENILTNEAAIQEAFEHDESSTVVGWLPMYHDMGLIGNILQPLCIGSRCILMSPIAFLSRPARWLQAITKYKAKTSGGPNFAYELCIHRISTEERARLDLSSWTLAFNGAEPIRAATLERFNQAFSPHGFKSNTFYPCYGLAEATLFVAGGRKTEIPITFRVSRTELQNGQVATQTFDVADSQMLVGCGSSWGNQDICIVDPNTCSICSPGHIGEIWLSGKNVSQRYWSSSKESPEPFIGTTTDGKGPFLRTGDLGAFVDRELVITGRIKDLIIIRGRNYYPQDIEQELEQAHPALRAGCGAAVSVNVDGDEQLVLIHEVRPEITHDGCQQALMSIADKILHSFGLSCRQIVLVQPKSLPKTSSGKLRRSLIRDNYLRDKLNPLATSPKLSQNMKTTSHHTSEVNMTASENTRHDSELANVRAAVERVLKLHIKKQVRFDDDTPFAVMGIDSLSSAQLAVELEQIYECSVGTSTVMQSRSIRHLSDVIAENRAGRRPKVLPTKNEASYETSEQRPDISPRTYRTNSLLFSSLSILYLALILGAPTCVTAYPILAARSSWEILIGCALSPLLFSTIWCLIAGTLSLTHQKSICIGEFDRDLSSPQYRHRRLYGLCWTAVCYVTPIYFIVLNIPPLKSIVFRLFGYRGSLNITIYPDTWIRDLPLLRIAEGAYIANRVTLGTNIVLQTGRIMIDQIIIGKGSVVGHLSVLGPGVTIGDRSTVANNCVIGLGVKIGNDVHVGAAVGIDHGTHIGDNARIGSRAYIGANSVIAKHTEVNPNASLFNEARPLNGDKLENWSEAESADNRVDDPESFNKSVAMS